MSSLINISEHTKSQEARPLTLALTEPVSPLSHLMSFQDHSPPVFFSSGLALFKALPVKISSPISQLFSSIVTQLEGKERSQLLSAIWQKAAEEQKRRLALAGVSSQHELAQKAKAIDNYKRLAEKLYFSSSKNIDLARETDMAILQALGREESRQTMVNFWDLIRSESSSHPLPSEIVLRLLYAVPGLTSHLPSMQKILISTSGEELFAEYEATRCRIIKKAVRSLCNEQNAGIQAIDDYFRLKAELFIPILLNNFLRKQLYAIQQDMQEQVERWKKFWDENKKKNIDSWSKQIIEAEQQVEKAKKRCEKDLNRDLYQNALEGDEIYLEGCKDILEEQQKRDTWEEAYSEVSIDPRNTALLLKRYSETHFEKLIIEYIETLLGGSLDKSSPLTSTLPSDLSLDLTKIDDPVKYFVEQKHRQDKNFFDKLNECLARSVVIEEVD